MGKDRIRPSDHTRQHPEKSLAERVQNVQEQAAKAGFGAASTTSPGDDKAFMDEMWGEN